MPASGHHTLSGLLIVTPATRTASALTAAPGAFGGVFVGAQAEECRLSQLVVRRPFRVRQLCDELRSDPRRAGDARRWIERCAVGAHPFELGASLRERPRRNRASLEHEEVEHGVARWARARGAASLQQLETRDAVLIERHQLAVEHEISIG